MLRVAFERRLWYDWLLNVSRSAHGSGHGEQAGGFLGDWMKSDRQPYRPFDPSDEIVRLTRINKNLVNAHNLLLVDGSKWQTRAERLQRALEFVREWHDAGEDSQELIKVMTVVEWALGGETETETPEAVAARGRAIFERAVTIVDALKQCPICARRVTEPCLTIATAMRCPLKQESST